MPLSPWKPSKEQRTARPRTLVVGLALAAILAGTVFFALRYAERVYPRASLPPTSRGGPTPTARAGQPALPLPASSSTALSDAEQTLRALDASPLPPRDLYALTARLRFKNSDPISRTVQGRPTSRDVGQTDLFYMSDLVEKHYYTVTATIKRVTDHAYWYVQDGSPSDEGSIIRAATKFEEQIYPTDRRLFGSEWTPGVDNDPRITVLFAPIPGAGGYFASADEYTRLVNPFSNQREIIYINTSLGWSGVESTLAHEFQHMIHWHEHANHDVWLNEAGSVLAQSLNGYDVGALQDAFLHDPDVQLNSWKPTPDEAVGNYGASFLFLDYLRSHYGDDKALRAVVSARGQGIDAVDDALASLGSKDRFENVFEKWALANLIDEAPGAKEAGLDYPDRQVNVSPVSIFSAYPKSLVDEVSQFGVDYVQLAPLTLSDTLHVEFLGKGTVPVIATGPHSGKAMWCSKRGDLADTMMTRRFDLRSLNKATLDYYIWYDTEGDIDYGYAEISTDNGATWNTLKTPNTVTTNPNGYNFGDGYTGSSATRTGADTGGWLHEEIDISRYAAKEALIRFEYITDDGYNAQGVAVDDISVPELNYLDDAESGTGWELRGFTRVGNVLPQRYYVAAVKFRQDGFDVQPVEVDNAGHASFDIKGLSSSGPYSKAVLLIAGLTNHTIQKAPYELDISAAP